jgi:hypothetical protein
MIPLWFSMLAMMQKKLTVASFAVYVYTSLRAVKWPQLIIMCSFDILILSY